VADEARKEEVDEHVRLKRSQRRQPEQKAAHALLGRRVRSQLLAHAFLDGFQAPPGRRTHPRRVCPEQHEDPQTSVLTVIQLEAVQRVDEIVQPQDVVHRGGDVLLFQFVDGALQSLHYGCEHGAQLQATSALRQADGEQFGPTGAQQSQLRVRAEKLEGRQGAHPVDGLEEQARRALAHELGARRRARG